jgi:hypothetical protein
MFASLDVILDEGPSRLGFRALAAGLEELAGDERSAAYAYLAERLDAWPDSTRCAPWSWFVALCRGRPPLPAWPLARSLELTHPVDREWRPDTLPADAGVLSGLAELTLSRPGRLWELVLDHPGSFAGLRTLRVGGGVDEDDGGFRPLSSSPLVRQLEVVELGDVVVDVQFGRPDLFRLLDDGTARYPAECLRSLGVRTPSVADMCRGLARYPLPALRELRVSFGRFKESARRVPAAARAALGRVERLQLEHVDADAFGRLAAVTELRPRSARVTRVARGEREPAAVWARMLGVSDEGVVEQLQHLNPSMIEASDGAVTALRLDLYGLPAPLKAPRGLDLSTVRTLHLTGHAAATSAMVDLLDAARLPQLRTLQIEPATGGGYHYTGEPVFQALLASGLLPRLESLTLRSPDRSPGTAGTWPLPRCLSDEIVESLARADLRRLTHLDLTGCSIGDRGAAALSQAVAPRLESLDLSLNDITAAGLAALLGGAFPSLRRLDMGFNEIGAGAAADGASPTAGVLDGLPRLRELILTRNPINAEFAGSGLAYRLLRQLWALNLSYNSQDDATLQALAKTGSASLVNLEYWKDENDEAGESSSGIFSDDTAREITHATAFARLDHFVAGIFEVEDDHGFYQVSLARPAFAAHGRAIITRSGLRSPAIASLEEPLHWHVTPDTAGGDQ